MALNMRQPLPPCCHAVNPGVKDATKADFKTGLSKYAVSSKQESVARLADALAEAHSTLRLDRNATSAVSGTSQSAAFSHVEDIQTYIKNIETYLALVKGFMTPSLAQKGLVVTPIRTVETDGDASTPSSALRQPLIEDYSPKEDAAKIGAASEATDKAPKDAAAPSTANARSQHDPPKTLSECLGFCQWKDALSNAIMFAPNARIEYAQALLASGVFMMNSARDKVDVLLARRLSEIDEQELKLAYQLFLHAAGVLDACLESIDVTPRTVGAKTTDLSAEPEPDAKTEGSGVDTIPDDDMMAKWRAEQQASSQPNTATTTAAVATNTMKAPGIKNDDLAHLNRIPDLARGRYPQLLAWIALAEAQELVILRGISREFVDYSLMARLSMDISIRYKECHAFATQMLPCSTSPVADKLRLYSTFKEAYYSAISCYFQGAASMEKDTAASCAQAIANFKKAKTMLLITVTRKQNYEAQVQKDEGKERLETFRSIFIRSEQIVDRDLDIMTHRNDSVYYERIPQPEPPCEPLSLVRAVAFPAVEINASVGSQPDGASPTQRPTTVELL
uniref:BRO1 domain-containing protein n=1 Tax=Globisporangium ultimum (strain ATCC 200006 / CBS 805.95 / DAOM BR144) TaxID=431595 RepID=K3X325_GLOUD